MTHDTALLLGYGLSALLLAMELTGLWRLRRQALARLAEARAEAQADALDDDSTAI